MIAKRLEKGDKIAIVSPSAILTDEEDLEVLSKTVEMMENEGFEIFKGRYAFSDDTGYGSLPVKKASDLNAAFANPEVKAIFSITGGENCLTTFDYLDWEVIKNNPKIFCGFSDTTSLLNEINEKTGLVTFHGPSFKSIASGETDYRFKAVVDRFIKGLDNLAYEEDLQEFKVIREGKAVGKTVGGNLSLTTDLIAGKYKIDFKDKILLLEDLAWESCPAKISHDLYKMKYEGIFDQISGIWIGNYDNEIHFEDILLEVISDIDFNKPIIKSENFGHAEKKIVIPIGCEVEIDTSKGAPYVKMVGEFIK